MTDVQVYDNEARFFLYWKGGAQKEKIQMTHIYIQGLQKFPTHKLETFLT